MSSRIIYIGTPDTDASRFAERARADFPGIDLFATNDRKVALTQLSNTEAVIGHHFQFDDELLQGAAKLRWIQSLTTGTDAILKLSSLRKEVIVTSTRGMHGPQMSELVFLQMLALGRKFPRMQQNQQAARWERWAQPLLMNKTAVIVGVGAISEVLAPRCKAFGMQVYGVSNSSRVPTGFDGIYSRDELTQAAAVADFLIIIVPHSPETDNLIDAKVIAAMKPTSFVINVARGGVLDEVALMNALNAKQLAGAAIDVFKQTPLPADHPLWRTPNVILTPHLGGMSDIYLDQAYPIVQRNLQHFLSNHLDQLLNVVAH